LEQFWQWDIVYFYMGLWNCSDSVALFVLIWDFETVLTVWHYLFLYGTLELFRQCGIICFSIGLWKCSDSVAFCFLYVTLELIRKCGIFWFSIGLWNCSDSVALLVFHFSIGLWNCSDSVALFVLIWDFGTVPTVWHYLFFDRTLEQFWQCEYYLFFYGSLGLFPQCIIIDVSIGLWNWSESVALLGFPFFYWTLLGFLLGFGTIPTVWHYWFFYGTFELFWHCAITCFTIGLWNCSESVALLVFHFSIGLWNCSDSVALFVFIWDFGTVLTVWHYLFV
jgi:hypothetical protein